MKKLSALLLALLIILGTASCGASGTADTPDGTADTPNGTFSVVVTIYPVYDWVLSVLGDNPANASVTLLLDSGVDMHSFQPTAADILTISACDLFVYVGGESDAWIDDALAEAVNGDMIVIDLIDELGGAARAEELVEGMESDEDDDDIGGAYDEHIWLSLRNASVLCGAIERALEAVDPANAAVYAANLASYRDDLTALDGRYAEAVENAAHDTLLFGDRFPFRYLTEDYGLTYYAAFAGCSAETEASFDTIVFLAGKLDELGLPAVLQIETSDGSVARTIVENTSSGGQAILTLNSMQSAMPEGATYLGVMEQNLAVLTEALG